MRVRTYRDADRGAYVDFMRDREDRLVYTSRDYMDLVIDVLGCSETTLVAERGGRAVGIFPLLSAAHEGRWVHNSLPFFGGYGGVLSDAPDATAALVGAYREMALGRDAIASTVVANPLTPADPVGYPVTLRDRRIGQFTDLRVDGDPAEALMSRIDGSARRNVRRAAAEGVRIERDPGRLGDLEALHRRSMTEKGGRAKPSRFFRVLPSRFRPGDDYDVWVATHDGATVAGLLTFLCNGVVEYYMPVIAREHRSTQATAAVIYGAMVDGSRRGFHTWNWGGTWASQTGVYRFKRKWGALERPYDYLTHVNDPSILDWSADRITETFPYFFVVPFASLRTDASSDQRV